MKIVLYGATGNIGQTILQEALERGHFVTAVVRVPGRLTLTHEHLSVERGDATDAEQAARFAEGHDAVVGSISGRRDGDSRQIVEAAEAPITGVSASSTHRLLRVGGAGSLETAPGVRLIDAPEFPPAYLSEALAQVEALSLFKSSQRNLDWAYLSPAAEIAPGERTSSFRIGADQLLVDDTGKSHISIEDFAVAVVNELEQPQHHRQRFTVAY